MSDNDKITWWMTSADHWATERSHRGYTATIVYAAGVGYTLTITGPSAPAAAAYPTKQRAKGVFRKFLTTK